MSENFVWLQNQTQAFHHLMIERCVHDVMLRDEAVRLHAACAAALVGVVDDVQLAKHQQGAGNMEQAAALFLAGANKARDAGVSQHTVVALYKVAWDCVGRCTETQSTRALEITIVHKQITTWTLSPEEMYRTGRRLQELLGTIL